MKEFFYRYEQSTRKSPKIWQAEYIMHRMIRKEIIYFSNLINKTSGGSVLDFGCGKAPYRAYFQSYKGADVDRNNKEPDYLIDSETNKISNISDNSIENIISIQVIEHVPNLEAYISEVKRILKPGGHFLVIAPFVYNYHGSDDYARYSRNYFERNSIFENFEIVKINGTPNDFVEFIAYNCSHFFGIFPIIRFFYPVYFIINLLGILLSKTFFVIFRMASIASPKFAELYKNSFLLFPLQVLVTFKKK